MAMSCSRCHPNESKSAYKNTNRDVLQIYIDKYIYVCMYMYVYICVYVKILCYAAFLLKIGPATSRCSQRASSSSLLINTHGTKSEGVPTLWYWVIRTSIQYCTEKWLKREGSWQTCNDFVFVLEHDRLIWVFGVFFRFRVFRLYPKNMFEPLLGCRLYWTYTQTFLHENQY